MFRSWKDLFDTNGEMSYQSPRLYSFNGRDVMHDSAWYVYPNDQIAQISFPLNARNCSYFRPRKQIWHGSNINGDKSIESFCATWESFTREKTGMAGSLSYRRLINNEKVSCENELIILCIETIPREEVPAN